MRRQVPKPSFNVKYRPFLENLFENEQPVCCELYKRRALGHEIRRTSLSAAQSLCP